MAEATIEANSASAKLTALDQIERLCGDSQTTAHTIRALAWAADRALQELHSAGEKYERRLSSHLKRFIHLIEIEAAEVADIGETIEIAVRRGKVGEAANA